MANVWGHLGEILQLFGVLIQGGLLTPSVALYGGIYCESKVQVFDTPQVVTVSRSNLMRLYLPVDLTGNLIMIEKQSALASRLSIEIVCLRLSVTHIYIRRMSQ